MGEGSDVVLSVKREARRIFSGTTCCATLSVDVVVVVVDNDDKRKMGESSVEGKVEEIGLAKVVQAPKTKSKVIVTTTQLRGIEFPFRRDRPGPLFLASSRRQRLWGVIADARTPWAVVTVAVGMTAKGTVINKVNRCGC